MSHGVDQIPSGITLTVLNNPFFSQLPCKTRALSLRIFAQTTRHLPMTKKARPPAKKANSFGSMGRILFYSVALIVACFAVAVVLFETEAGREIVAKVRGRRTSSTRAGAKPTFSESKQSEGKTNKDSVETKKEDQAKSDESALPREDSVLKDTSAKQTDNAHEAQSSESRNDRESNDARQENTASESTRETAKENTRQHEEKTRVDETTSNTVSGDSNNEKEAWEILERDKPVEEQDKPVEVQDTPVEEQDKSVEDANKPDKEQHKPVEEKDKPVEEPDKLVEEPVFKESFASASETDVGQKEVGGKEEHEFSEEKEMKEEHDGKVDESLEKQQEEKSDKKDVEQEVDETIKVGDSLAELEKQRTKERHIKEERYDPIPEPEGPPIDQSPVNARRGLRGDYGGKGNMRLLKLFCRDCFNVSLTPNVVFNIRNIWVILR